MDACWNPFADALSARHDRLRIAIRRGGALLNTYREVRWDVSAPAGPYAVYLARDGLFFTLALDLDCGDADALRDQATVLRAILDRAGVRYVETRSGGSAHGHLLSTWPAGLPAREVADVMRALRSLAPDLDITPMFNPMTGAIRPPGSPHRSGGVCTVIGDDDTALRVLQTGNAHPAWTRLHGILALPDSNRIEGDNRLAATTLPDSPTPPRTARTPAHRREPSPRIAKLIADGDTEGRYRDRSALAFAITVSLVQAGWALTEYSCLAEREDAKGLDHLRRAHLGDGHCQRRRDVADAARRMWNAATDFVHRNPAIRSQRPDVAHILAGVGRAVRAAGWGGQGGPTERAVLDELLRRGWHLGRVVIGMSVRLLADACGVSRSAAAAALRRLIRDGWLVEEAPRVGRAAGEYRLLERHAPSSRGWTLDQAPLVDRPQDSGVNPGYGISDRYPLEHRPMVHHQHDALSAEALGRVAALILATLSEEPADLARLQQRTWLCRRTLIKHLRRLHEHHLVSDAAGVWTAASSNTLPSALAATATALGSVGVLQRRRDYHRDESAAYAWWLADHLADTGWSRQRGLRRDGHSTLTGTERRIPRTPFPHTADGRRCWRAALALTVDGFGLQADELAAVDLVGRLPGEPAVTQSAATVRTVRRRQPARSDAQTDATRRSGDRVIAAAALPRTVPTSRTARRTRTTYGPYSAHDSQPRKAQHDYIARLSLIDLPVRVPTASRSRLRIRRHG